MKPIERLEKLSDSITDWTVALSLFGNEDNMDFKRIIKNLDKITNSLNDIIVEIKKEI